MMDLIEDLKNFDKLEKKMSEEEYLYNLISISKKCFPNFIDEEIEDNILDLFHYSKEKYKVWKTKQKHGNYFNNVINKAIEEK